MEEISRAKSQNVTDICIVGAKFVPLTIQSSVKFCDFVKQYLRSLLTYHLFIFLKCPYFQGALSSSVDGYSLTGLN